MQISSIRRLFSSAKDRQNILINYADLRVYKNSSILCLMNRLLYYQLIKLDFVVKKFHPFSDNVISRYLTGKFNELSINSIMVAGKTCEEAGQQKLPVHSILQYIGFDALNNEFTMDLNSKIILKSIDHTNPARRIIALKISSLKSSNQIKRNASTQQQIIQIWDNVKDKDNKANIAQINDYLMGKYRSLQKEELADFHSNIMNNLDIVSEVQWKTLVHSYYYLDNHKNDNMVIRAISQNSNQDLSELRNVALRITKIIQKAESESCQVLVDCELSWLQNDIESIITQYSVFNKNRSIVFATIQSYLYDSGSKVKQQLDMAKELDVKWAIRLVGSSFMAQERDQTTYRKQPDGVCEHYNKNAQTLISHLSDGHLVLSTQTEDSILKAIDQLNEKNQDRVLFAQMLGIADHLTHSLKLQGFQTAKLLMFGETHQLRSWLSRRAQEHRDSPNTQIQQRLIMDELYRRSVFYS